MIVPVLWACAPPFRAVPPACVKPRLETRRATLLTRSLLCRARRDAVEDELTTRCRLLFVSQRPAQPNERSDARDKRQKLQNDRCGKSKAERVKQLRTAGSARVIDEAAGLPDLASVAGRVARVGDVCVRGIEPAPQAAVAAAEAGTGRQARACQAR